MQISSPAFSDGDAVPVQYTCEGDNVNPPLAFSDVPPEAQSLVLIVEDPDAPNPPWVHWLLFDIPPQTAGIAENAVPEGCVEGRANGGTPGYEGPCPPGGTHRYFFRLYALDRLLGLPATADRVQVLAALQGSVIAQAELLGTCQGPARRRVPL